MKAYFEKLERSTFVVRNMFIILLFCVAVLYSNLQISYSNKHEPEKNNCGVILFVHINKCGGGSVVHWFKKHTSVLHLKQEGRPRNAHDFNDTSILWQKVIPKVNEALSHLSNRSGWKVLHLHHYFPGIFYVQKIIQNWETIVQNKGCAFHKTTILRDPLHRFVSNVNFNKPPINTIEKFMNSRRNWLIRYFLFGICGYHNNDIYCGYDPKGDFTMTPNLNETHIGEAKKIIYKFDSIGFMEEFGDYLENIRTITGWTNDAYPIENMTIHKSSDYFNMTSKPINNFIKLNQDDYMYYYAIKNEMTKVF